MKYINKTDKAIHIRLTNEKGYSWKWVEPNESIDLEVNGEKYGLYIYETNDEIKKVETKISDRKVETKRIDTDKKTKPADKKNKKTKLKK